MSLKPREDEELREALLELQRAREDEKGQRQVLESIIQALRMLSAAPEPADALREVLRNASACVGSQTAVLVWVQDGTRRHAALGEAWASHDWGSVPALAELSSVEEALYYDANYVPELAGIPQGAVGLATLPLVVGSVHGALMVGHVERGGLSRRDLSTLRRFVPLLVQAIAHTSSRELESVARFARETDEPVLRLSLEGDLLYCNEQGQDLLVDGELPDELVRIAVRHSLDRTRHVEAEVGGRTYSLAVVPVLVGGYVNVFGYDITRRKQLEENLHATSNRLGTLISSLGVGVLAETVDGQVSMVNPRFCEAFELEEAPAALVGRMADDLVAEIEACMADGASFAEFRRAVHAQGGPPRTSLETRDGRTLEVSSSPVEDDGREVGRLWQFDDVTDRKRTEARLAMLSLVARKTGSTVIITDANGYVEWVNDAFTSMTGYRLEEMRGHKLGEMLQGPDTDPATVEVLRRAIAEGRDVTTEILNYTKRGDPYWVTMNVTAVRDEEGRIENYIAVESDVTVARKIKDELVRARDAAEDANRSKSEFLAVMSHEIRTPLNAILGMTDLVLQERLTAEQRSMVRTVQSNSEALLGIIDDVLDLSRVESGEVHLESVRFGPGDLAESVTDALGVHADGKDVELTCQVEVGVPALVEGDEQRVRQVLTNLVGNAVKFTERGSVSVTVGADVLGEGDRVELSLEVADTGVGIASDKLDAVFGRFVQADSSTRRRFGGTGLGLAISRALVEQMGGRIWCDSELGRGSTFHVRVPLPVLRWKPERSGLASSMSTLTALVVDPQPRSRAVVAETLRGWGLEVEATEEPSRVVEELTRPSRDLLFLDLGMAAGLRRAIVRSGRRPILMTRLGQFDPDLARELRASLVTKPVRRETLLTAMGATLGWSGEAAQPSPKPALERRIGQGRSVLVVDDSRDSRAVVARYAALEGFEVTEAEDAATALDALAERSFDLMLTDLEMPGMDGFELVVETRRRSAHRTMPIVAITAHAVEGYEQRCFDAGMNGYVTKPVRRPAFSRALSEALEPPLRVLMVDDSEDMRTLVRRFLDSEGGFTVAEAAGGERALELARDGAYDVALLDMIMPGMSGLELATRLAEEHPSLPCVAMSGLDRSEDRNFALEAGCVEVLVKPVRRSTLVEALRKAASAEAGSAASSRVDVDPEIAELVPGFLASRRKEHEELVLALSAGDWDLLRRVGHTLKGVGSSYGFDLISELGARLEQRSREEDSVMAAEVLRELGLFLRGVQVSAGGVRIA